MKLSRLSDIQSGYQRFRELPQSEVSAEGTIPATDNVRWLVMNSEQSVNGLGFIPGSMRNRFSQDCAIHSNVYLQICNSVGQDVLMETGRK